MTGASTTREDVERLACLVYPPGVASGSELKEVAATLRALLDERDRLARMHATAFDAAVDAQAERDAARAEVENLKRLLGRYLNETPLGHQPHMIAHEARAALAGAPRHE